MKEAENKEIALLLKDLGRRHGPAAAVQGDHLDADELSSFAEGVLPPATRAVYAGHVADCDSCRSVVAKLALAAGTAAETKTEQVPAAGLWRYFEGLFSQKFMRFAVPVMSIVILSAIAFVWFKRDVRRAELAQRSTTAESKDTNQAVPLSGFLDSADNSNAKGDSRGNQPATKEATEKESKEAKQEKASKGAAADQETARNEGSAAKSKTAEADKPKEEVKTARAGVAAAAPAPPADQPAPKSATRARDDADEKKPEPTPTDAVARREVREVKDEKKREDENKKADSEDKATRRAFGGFSGLMAQKAETKTVSGRRFVHQNNRWVDTAYQSSTSLTNVTRNSEQYRALIGDEPGLRAIAEQLEGEVIVVWKDKAYRIK